MNESGTPETGATRIIIYTGKGGVGKTTCSAATAIRVADSGRRTLIVSTDPAHSLGDCLQMQLGSAPTPITAGLWGVEIDALAEMRSRFGVIREGLIKQMKERGVEEALAEEMVAFPGSLELFSILRVAELKASGEFDVVIVDTAPTGNTMRFLHFPEFLAPVRRAMKVDQAYSRLIRPLASFLKNHVPDDAFYTSTYALFDQIEAARRLVFTDDTFFRFVLNPDKLSLVEAQRAVSSLNVSGYVVDAIIINKILPDQVQDAFFHSWKKSQRTHVAEARTSFFPLRVFEVPLRDQEVLGETMLRDLAAELYEDQDPLARLTNEDMFRINANHQGVVMDIMVPYPNKSEFKLFREGQELDIEIGSYRHRVQLPALLWHMDVAQAKYEGNQLSVEFRAGAGAG